MKEHTHDNDDEPLTFVRLAVAAASVMQRLIDEQTPREADRPEKTKERQNKEPEHKLKRILVERSVQDLIAFERRAKGIK